MKIKSSKWLGVAALLAASGLGLVSGQWSVVSGQSSVSAAAPTTDVQTHGDASLPTTDLRRESVPPSNGPAPLTGPASRYNPLPRSPLDIPAFGDNYRANTDPQSPTNLAQQEPSISINPTNPLNVVVAAKDERAGSNTKQDWIYTSTDGGVTWLNQQFPLLSPTAPFSSDPVVNFSDDGICYVTALPYGGGLSGIQVARSTDSGLTFLPATVVTNNGDADKEWTWVDNFPSSPYYHRIYDAWMDFAASPATVRLNYSSDRGRTWSAQSTVTTAVNQFPMPVVLPNGDVLVTYRSSSGPAAYGRSTDGGVTFGPAQTIAPITSPARPPGAVWRLSPDPATAVNPTNGNMVIMWSDGTGGGATVRYSRGSNNGATWSPVAVLAPSGVAMTH